MTSTEDLTFSQLLQGGNLPCEASFVLGHNLVRKTSESFWLRRGSEQNVQEPPRGGGGKGTAKAVAQRVEVEMREMYGDDGEYDRELMYESAGLAVFLRSRYDRATTESRGGRPGGG